MDKYMKHYLEYKKALDIRNKMHEDSPEARELDEKIAYESLRSWICLAREALEVGESSEVLSDFLIQQGYDSEDSKIFAEWLMNAVALEKQGHELTAEIFHEVFSCEK